MGWKQKERKRYTVQTVTQERCIAILVTDERDFKKKTSKVQYEIKKKECKLEWGELQPVDQ